MSVQNIDVRRVSALPATLVKNTLYFVKADGESLVRIFVTNNDGTIAATQVAQRHRGTYSAGGSYVFGDQVLDQGSTFVNILASTGIAPPTLPTGSNANWQLVAKSGSDGAAGADGADGAAGADAAIGGTNTQIQYNAAGALGGAADFYYDAVNDRVGLGVATPAHQFDLSGNLQIPTTTADVGTIYQAGSRLIHSFGTNNLFVGTNAGNYTMTGSGNLGNGASALQFNTTGSSNVANGASALRFNTTGIGNVANGPNVLYSNTTGTSNVANGLNSLYSNTTGANNIAVGTNALYANTTGANNIAVSTTALRFNTTGSNNLAIGNSALYFNTTGSANSALGLNALYFNTTGFSNVAFGPLALFTNTTGSNNVGFGNNALRLNSTGSSNTACGFSALFDVTTGINNIGIGSEAGRSTSPRTITTASNEIVIGNNSHTGAFVKVDWTVTSDQRDKTGFAPILHGLDFIKRLKPTEYQFKKGGRDGTADGVRRYGFLAQEVLAAEGDNPVIVNNDDLESLKMTNAALIPVLVNAIQELSTQLTNIKAELAAIKGQ